MNETQQTETIDAHVVAFKNEKCYKSSKVTVVAYKPQESVSKTLEEVKRQLWYFSQENEVKIHYVKVEDGFENRHIYTLEVTAPIEIKLYESSTPDWQQSGQNLDIPRNVLETVQEITGTKPYGVKVHLSKLKANGLSKIDKEEVTLEASFVKIVKRKHYAIRSD